MPPHLKHCSSGSSQPKLYFAHNSVGSSLACKFSSNVMLQGSIDHGVRPSAPAAEASLCRLQQELEHMSGLGSTMIIVAYNLLA
jgi:hypothetical protein